jgi:outer membrane protein assembly factor BamE (lipoprotein component of BamABCDE complex)
VFNEYRGIQIGQLADDVRKKLGTPADKGDEQDFYVFGEKETAQILYDKGTRKVVAISVDFTNGATSVLTPQQVFGAEIEAKPDGSKYRLVRYPKAGYWLSYSRTAGDTPIITVTIQKLQGQ